MKARIQHEFLRYASKFSVESMLLVISQIAFDIYTHTDEVFNGFAGYRNYKVCISGGRIINDKVLVVQTWLIDLIYELSLINSQGNKIITRDEALYLIHLYDNYLNEKDKLRFKAKHHSKIDALLYVCGFFGEQKRFEELHRISEEFSREKYILEVISMKPEVKSKYGIAFTDEFIVTTGLTTDMYSAILFTIFGYVSQQNPIIDLNLIKDIFSAFNFSLEDIMSIIERYSCSVDELAKSNLKRQLLYKKPFIRYNNYIVSANPFLVASLFVNSNYWIMRDKYSSSKTDSQKFPNTFGGYFEEYFKEILNNCLPKDSFKKIDECAEPRADWHIALNDLNFLIEQKSGLSILKIKQNESNTEAMKEHILNNWGKAVKQLDNTEKSFGLKDAIKIILVYEDYYKSECLDLLFEIDPTLKPLDNKKFWLLTINEFEKLLNLFKKDKDLFFEIIKEKDTLEITLQQMEEIWKWFLEDIIFLEMIIYMIMTLKVNLIK